MHHKYHAEPSSLLVCLVHILALLTWTSVISVATPLYDCIEDVQHHPICSWTTSELHTVLSSVLLSSTLKSTGLTDLVDRLEEEDVDGNVWLSLEKEEFEMLADSNTGKSTTTAQAALTLRQQVFKEYAGDKDTEKKWRKTPRDTPTNPPPVTTHTCIDVINHLSSQQQSVLAAIEDDMQTMRDEPSLAVWQNYTGQYPSAPLSRVLPALLRQHHPRLIVFLGPQPVDISGSVYSYSPDALIMSITEHGAADPLSTVQDKIQLRQQTQRGLATRKRYKSANINLVLPLRTALCILLADGIVPDMVWMSVVLFALPAGKEAERSCVCEWWNYPNMIIGGSQSPNYTDLHSLALMTNHRIYSDQPVFLLSKPALSVHCYDLLGHMPLLDQPLLGLYMIVKNEIGGIADTLRSVLPYLDAITVLDTGSTDGTPDLITDMINQYAVDGQVHHGPFIDFSTTRNAALALASKENTTFILMLNGDDTLIHGEDIRLFLSTRVHLCGPSDEMYLLSVDYEGHKLSWSERIMRTSNHQYPDWPNPQKHWHYVGLTHESYTHIPYASGALGEYGMTYAGRTIAGTADDGYRFHIYHTYVRDTPDKLKARAQKDILLLKQQLETMPDDPRTMYYISHSYDVQEDYVNAQVWHKRRTDRLMAAYKQAKASGGVLPGGDREECTCLLRLGKIPAFRLPEEYGGWKEALYWFHVATELCNDQIESRFYLAEYYWSQGEPQKAWKWIREADALIRDQRGLAHVLENDTVYDRVPRLYQAIQTWREENKDKIKTSNKKTTNGKKKKPKAKKEQQAHSSKEEL